MLLRLLMTLHRQDPHMDARRRRGGGGEMGFCVGPFVFV